MSLKKIESLSDVEGYRDYLDSLNKRELEWGIEALKESDLASMDAEKIKEAILAVLGPKCRLVKNLFFNTIPVGKLIFCRVRRPAEIEKMREPGWYWEKPFDLSNRTGRLDYLSSSVMYTSLTPGGALIETEHFENNPFVMIYYRNKKEITLATVGSCKDPFLDRNWRKELKEDQLEKADIILDLANDLILWDKGEKSKSHKLSRAAADFFLGNGGFDGVLLKSVWDQRELERNVAFLNPSSILEMVVAEECVKLNQSLFGVIIVNGIVELGYDVQRECNSRLNEVKEHFISMGYERVELDQIRKK